MRAGIGFGAIILSALAARAQTPRLDSSLCAECHGEIWRSFRATGMGRSFFRPTAENNLEDYTRSTYYHPASGTYFQMIRRGERYFQRQYQLAPDGRETNVTETGIDFVMGSGNHARTYLHRTANNQLIELPLGWYAEQGGYWAMNPGYDRPDHAGLSRAIPYACMFCHNAYPEVSPARGPRDDPVFLGVPQGIDCQRCHGDGGEHARLAGAPGSRSEDARRAIVNPSRLPRDRQMEVCLQCHLEPASATTSNLIVRYERQPFSYRPGEVLADFRLHFDQKAPSGNEDRFEIAGASAYRLTQSRCFRKSGGLAGAITCTSCHDPHRALTQAEAARHYSDACRKCHAAQLETLLTAARHPASTECVSCHMPKRRTQDAVHVVMTDHYIQRPKPARDLLAPIREELHSDNRGPLVFYDSPSVLHPSDELYLAIAEVNVNSRRAEGIAHLAGAIARFRPAAAEYYLQLGDALRAEKRYAEAIAPYEEAVRREPRSAIAHLRLGLGLTRIRGYRRADTEIQEALRLAPSDAAMRKDIGLSYLEQGRFAEAAAAFTECLAIDSNQPEALNGLAGARWKTGDLRAAEAAFLEAIRLRPHYAEARHNLANLLASAERVEEADPQFREVLRLNPNHAGTRLDYARMLARANRGKEAREQAEAVLRLENAAAGQDTSVRDAARKLLDSIR